MAYVHSYRTLHTPLTKITIILCHNDTLYNCYFSGYVFTSPQYLQTSFFRRSPFPFSPETIKFFPQSQDLMYA